MSVPGKPQEELTDFSMQGIFNFVSGHMAWAASQNKSTDAALMNILEGVIKPYGFTALKHTPPATANVDNALVIQDKLGIYFDADTKILSVLFARQNITIYQRLNNEFVKFIEVDREDGSSLTDTKREYGGVTITGL